MSIAMDKVSEQVKKNNLQACQRSFQLQEKFISNPWLLLTNEKLWFEILT